MARQRAKRHDMKRNILGREYDPNPSATFHANRQDNMVNDAQGYLELLPKNIRNTPGAQQLVDALVTVKYLPTDPRAQASAALGGGVIGGIGLTGSALQAYNDQQTEYLPTGPLSIAGRMVSNLGNSNTVGTDPLAEARNKVSEARQIVGTEAMLEALTTDEIAQLRGEQEVAMTPVEYEQMAGIQQMIDNRAKVLMQQPIQRSDGSVMPMPYDTAQRLATEQINMEMRAGQVY